MEEYNITRPLTVLLEPGEIGPPYDNIFRDPISGSVPDPTEVEKILTRTCARNGFIPLWGELPDERYKAMGRRVEPRDHPAAPTDKAITPPDPPIEFKTIQKLEDWGYNVYDDDEDEDLHRVIVGDTYTDVGVSQFQAVRIPAPSTDRLLLDEFIHFDVGTTAGNTLAVTQAWNKKNDARPRDEKLPLRDIILALWVSHLGRAAHDLSAIIYYGVIEKELADRLFPFVYALMDKDMLTKVVLNRETTSPQEERAFSLLLKEAPFCIGVNKMLEEFEEFAGVYITSLEFIPLDTEDPDPESKPPFHFRIEFHKVERE